MQYIDKICGIGSDDENKKSFRQNLQLYKENKNQEKSDKVVGAELKKNWRNMIVQKSNASKRNKKNGSRSNI